MGLTPPTYPLFSCEITTKIFTKCTMTTLVFLFLVHTRVFGGHFPQSLTFVQWKCKNKFCLSKIIKTFGSKFSRWGIFSLFQRRVLACLRRTLGGRFTKSMEKPDKQISFLREVLLYEISEFALKTFHKCSAITFSAFKKKI